MWPNVGSNSPKSAERNPQLFPWFIDFHEEGRGFRVGIKIQKQVFYVLEPGFRKLVQPPINRA
jgi:hypothetical protein